MDAVEIGKRIKKYRLAKGLTQKQLADLLYTDYKKVSKWENGHVRMDLELITKICNALDISVHDFLDGIDTKQKFTKIIKVTKFLWNNIFKILFIIAFILLLVFFINNRGVMKYYNVKSDSLDLNVEQGMFLESKFRNVLVLNNIKVYNIDYDILNIKLRLYTFVNNEKTFFYESDSLDSIMIKEYYGVDKVLTSNIIDAMKKGFYLTIDITDTNKETHTYETKLDLIFNFSNTHLVYFKNNDLVNDSIVDLTNFDINETMLVNSNFKKDNSTNTYSKQVNKNLSVTIDLKSQKITIYLKSKNKDNFYYIYYKQNYFKSLKSINKINVNNYEYQYVDNLLKCYQGKCDTYKEDSEYILNLVDKLF